MPIIRESPHSKISPDKNAAQWPPKSPFQALLSSPGGRKKWQGRSRRRQGDDRSVSPSPVKGARKLSEEDGNEEDEDEETLRLQLAAIEAKLKLKKLTNAKKDRQDSADGGTRAKTALSARAETSPSRKAVQSPTRNRSRPDTGNVGENVEVPLSPTNDRRREPEPQASPARKRLGLAPTLKGDGVSLKRARDGTQLPAPGPVGRALLRCGGSLNGPEHMEELRQQRAQTSFSERLNQSKAEALEKQERDEKIAKTRSKGFQRSESNNVKDREAFAYPSGSTRHQTAGEAKLARTSSTRSSHSNRKEAPRGRGLFTPSQDQPPTKASGSPIRGQHARRASDSSLDIQHQAQSSDTLDDTSERPTTSYDDFSSTHLSKRNISHSALTRQLAEKEIYTLPRLLKEVKAPDYEPPDCEEDFVILAILASKSQPYDQQQRHRTSDEKDPQEDATASRNKFMVLHLTDLKWELDLFLFGTAFDQFWKLTPGTLLAILNPGIMPPKNSKGGTSQNGRFCLKLGSSEDSVLEIGVARDLGWCEALRKDGKECGSWVDKRKTGVCEFHLSLAVEREGRKGRMEVNTMWRSHEGTGGAGRGRGGGGPGSRGGRGGKEKGNFHHEYGRLYSVPTGLGFGGGSAAGLLDAEDKLHGQELEEASRKRIAAQQRERDLAKKLGAMGRGVGAEYLRSKHPQTSSQSSAANSNAEQGGMFDKPSVSSLGLLSNKPNDVHLSPAKDRKRHFGMGAISSSGPEAMGWGGSRKAGLLAAKETRLSSPEKGQMRLDGVTMVGVVRDGDSDAREARSRSASPSKKKARFALDKGIREPGRESLGQRAAVGGAEGGAEDDDLDIV